MSTSRDVLALLQQLRKGAWTNEYQDPNYGRHWNVAPSGGDAIQDSVMGVAVRQTPAGKVKSQVNVRFGEDQVYIDTPSIEAVGPLARLAQRGMHATRLDQPVAAPAPANVRRDQPFTLQTPQGAVEIRPNPSAYIGRPSELPARQQISNTWHLLRGK